MSRRPKPTKQCPVCDRPFTWRARWKRNWESVVYCSRRCAGRRRELKQQRRDSG
jgi:hypothetical protein